MNVPKPQSSTPLGRATCGSDAAVSPGGEHGSEFRDAATAVTLGLERIYEPIARELRAVDQIVEQELSNDTPWIDRLLEQNWIRGGKRIRPVLVLLSGGACGELTQGHLYLSAAIELIHAASLVHDDVIDKAVVRRHLPTVNATWGDRTSVLLGDYLFTHAFYVASLAENVAAVKEIAKSSNLVCEGEIRQNAWEGDFDLSESDYLDMIRDKTGELCRCSCVLGAMMSHADRNRCDDFGSYGSKLGVAFQIIDDVLDLVGQQKRVGKTLGTDVTNQKATLPILHSLRTSPKIQREALLEMLHERDAAQIQTHLTSTGSIEYAYGIASQQLNEAGRFAEQLPRSVYSTALQNLAHFVLNRTH